MTGSGITRLFVVGERRITLRQSALRASLHGMGGTGEESPRVAPSFRDDAKRRTRNPEIPRCAIAHLRFASSTRPGMTKRLRHAGEEGLFRRVHRVWGSDMHPYAIEPKAEQPLLLVGAIEHFGQRKL